MTHAELTCTDALSTVVFWDSSPVIDLAALPRKGNLQRKLQKDSRLQLYFHCADVYIGILQQEKKGQTKFIHALTDEGR